MSLSDSIAATELAQQGVDAAQSKREQLNAIISSAPRVDPEMMVEKAPADLSGHLQEIAKFMAKRSEDLDDDVLVFLNAEQDITLAQVLGMIKNSFAFVSREVDNVSAQLSVDEQRLRGRLRLIAQATDEEGDQ